MHIIGVGTRGRGATAPPLIFQQGPPPQEKINQHSHEYTILRLTLLRTYKLKRFMIIIIMNSALIVKVYIHVWTHYSIITKTKHTSYTGGPHNMLWVSTLLHMTRIWISIFSHTLDKQ